ncbi:MAG: GDP-mannose 4,6-dehydratase [Nanoarchaeota archaeon]|nr:GDP-mannose 4,6-dehydratase [Nanoarchaeota archaeon]
MKAFITGAGGFMGPHLAKYLHEKGEEVFSTYYEPISDINELKKLGKAEELDVRDKTKFKKMLEEFKPDAVYHLAAQSYPTVSWEKPNYTIQANVEGTINLFESLKELNLNPVVIVACSSAEYGFVKPEEVPISEEHSLLPLHPYGVSKVAQDFLTYQYYKNFGMRGIRIRIFNTTGPGKVNDVCSDFTKQAVMIEKGLRAQRSGLPNDSERRMKDPVFTTGNLNAKRAITDVRDIIRAFHLLAEKGTAGEVYNVSGEKAYLIKDILDIVIKTAGIKVTTETDPKLLRPTDEPIIFGDSTKLKNETGWKQEIPIEKTIKDMIEFWRNKLR